jgi:hypothetical protein
MSMPNIRPNLVLRLNVAAIAQISRDRRTAFYQVEVRRISPGRMENLMFSKSS